MSEPILAKLRANAMAQAKSALDIARDKGFRGSASEWLDSLRGQKGERGDSGVNGKDGAQGPRGATGQRGDVGPMPMHEWRGTELRFQMAPDSWGPFVDLKGDPGEAGSGKTTYVGAAVAVESNSWEPSGW